MANPQDRPDDPAHAAPTGADRAPLPPPADAPPADEAEPAKKAPAKKAPAKAAKKAQKAAPKKAPGQKAPAKKAPEKNPVAKKAPATPPPKKAEPPAPKPPDEAPAAQRADTNGHVTEAAKETAAQAKSTVDAADNPVSLKSATLQAAGQTPAPLAVAVVVSLLALLLIRQLWRRGS